MLCSSPGIINNIVTLRPTGQDERIKEKADHRHGSGHRGGSPATQPLLGPSGPFSKEGRAWTRALDF